MAQISETEPNEMNMNRVGKALAEADSGEVRADAEQRDEGEQREISRSRTGGAGHRGDCRREGAHSEKEKGAAKDCGEKGVTVVRPYFVLGFYPGMYSSFFSEVRGMRCMVVFIPGYGAMIIGDARYGRRADIDQQHETQDDRTPRDDERASRNGQGKSFA